MIPLKRNNDVNSVDDVVPFHFEDVAIFRSVAKKIRGVPSMRYKQSLENLTKVCTPQIKPIHGPQKLSRCRMSTPASAIYRRCIQRRCNPIGI